MLSSKEIFDRKLYLSLIVTEAGSCAVVLKLGQGETHGAAMVPIVFTFLRPYIRRRKVVLACGESE